MNETLLSIIHYAGGPVVGAVIGYFTNYIAIKMLFRPREEKHIGRFRVPFTPGIVPRRKDQLAGVLGAAVAKKLWGMDDLEGVFTSDYLTGAFADGLTDLVYGESIIEDVFGGSAELPEPLKEEISVRLLGGALRADFAGLLSGEVNRIIAAKINIPFLSNISGDIADAASGALSAGFENYLLEHGREIAEPLIVSEWDELKKQKTADVADAIFGGKSSFREAVARAYSSFIKKYARPIVATIDVGGMITDKILDMSAVDVEDLVLDVVKRELRYVVLLGGLIGAVIGAVNVFI